MSPRPRHRIPHILIVGLSTLAGTFYACCQNCRATKRGRKHTHGIEQAAHLSYVGGVTTPSSLSGSGPDSRITTNPAQCGGRPCVRGMRIRVTDVLDLLGEGLSPEEILEELPDLEAEDVRACVQFARQRVDHPVLAG